jgi:hypothetical protein
MADIILLILVILATIAIRKIWIDVIMPDHKKAKELRLQKGIKDSGKYSIKN